jgi:cell division inhibitor SepF
MSTLHKVKAYFGMAPMEEYDDEYYEDDDRGASRGYSRRPREDRFDDDGYGRGYEGREYDEPSGGYRGYRDEDRFESRLRGPREFDRPTDLGRPRFSALRGSTRGALAMDPRRMAMLFDEGSPLSKITTLRPKDYSEARTIGERFRDGTPVIMDLVSMDNADAKRLVDFAAGLAFALRGSFDKVATKVFLLSPADIDVSAEERRRIAEAGFYSYQ